MDIGGIHAMPTSTCTITHIFTGFDGRNPHPLRGVVAKRRAYHLPRSGSANRWPLVRREDLLGAKTYNIME